MVATPRSPGARGTATADITPLTSPASAHAPIGPPLPRRYTPRRTTIGRKGNADADQALGQVQAALPPRHRGADPGTASQLRPCDGLTQDEIDRPFVGVATCWNEAAPCNVALNRQAQSVKKGVAETGGTPRAFTTITVTDGIALALPT
jgi:hypothetical protein